MTVAESAEHRPESDAAAPPGSPPPGARHLPPRITALRLIAVGVPSFFVGVIGTLVVWAATRAPEPPVLGSPAASAPGVVAGGASGPSAVRTGMSVGGGAEGEARRALARFRDGIGLCVRDVIGVLPGTSPPIPITLKLMKDGVYASAPSDFKTPVYACANYSETAPQPFQIQWQNDAVPNEGLGVAWLDDDHDGTPDRAFGFTAKLVKKKEVTFGEIVPLSPLPKVLPGR